MTGAESFLENYVKDKVKDWVTEIKIMGNNAKAEPEATHVALIDGVQRKWHYLVRNVPHNSPLLRPLKRCTKETL